MREEQAAADRMSSDATGWGYWWRRRESNPRPQALDSQDYMLSLVIWISPRARRPAG